MKAMLRNAVAPSIPRAMITDNATNDYNEVSAHSEFKLQLAGLRTNHRFESKLKAEP